MNSCVSETLPTRPVMSACTSRRSSGRLPRSVRSAPMPASSTGAATRAASASGMVAILIILDSSFG
jgi:hypothetical protein